MGKRSVTVGFQRIRALLFGAAIVLPVVVGGCRPRQVDTPGAAATDSPLTQRPEIALPPKRFSRSMDGSLEVSGHWRLVESQAAQDQTPFGLQTMNSTVVRCWPLRNLCEEYKAQISAGILFPSEPVKFRITSSEAGQILAVCDFSGGIELRLHIEPGAEYADLEYRREPSPSTGRVFERWILN